MRTNGLGITLLLLIGMATAVLAVAPTDEAIQKWKTEGTLGDNMRIWKEFKARGGCSGETHDLLDVAARKQALATGQAVAVDTLHVLVILVDFSDHVYTGQGFAGLPAQFDSIMFSDRTVDAVYNPTGSMTEFYMENSYGTVYFAGDVTTKWYRMPNPYSYYLGTDKGLTNSTYLARDAVLAANADINYTKYDNNNNGVVDGVIVIHPGKGGEEGGDDIWSHKYTMANPGVLDGKTFGAYTMNPEEFGTSLSPIGVFTHEYGHVLGMPDLYDIDYTPESSKGLGSWSLMSVGSYNSSGKKPAHFDAWCKLSLGFVTAIDIDSSLYRAQIPAVEYSPVVYRLKENPGGFSPEYWLVENRQRFGFDVGLPSSGLFIYHIDDTRTGNTDYLRYRVGLEQADNHNDLALTANNNGDAGDPWPGNTDNRNFHDLSLPNSRNYSGATTEVGVWDISDNDSVMVADLDVRFSRPYLKLVAAADSMTLTDAAPGGDGDGIFEAGETIAFNCKLKNYMRPAFAWYLELSCDNPNVQFVTNDTRQSLSLNPGLSFVASDNPVKFTLPSDFQPDVANFTVHLRADSVYSASGLGDRAFEDTFNLRASLGAPRVLVLDDDNGANIDSIYDDILTRLRVPHTRYVKLTSGSPASSLLQQYPVVLWFTGDDDIGGTITMSDITAMRGYLDNGGNLSLASFKAAQQIATLDPTMLPNYFHATWTDVALPGLLPFYKAYDGTDPWAPSKFRQFAAEPSRVLGTLAPGVGGVAVFYSTNSLGTTNAGTIAVSYEGSYRTFLSAHPIEYVTNELVSNGWMAQDSLMLKLLLFLGNSTTTDVGDEPDILPSSFTLAQNYPNPFNPSTEIGYSIASSGAVKGQRTQLTIYNMLGQRVRNLVDVVQGPGQYRATWDGTDETGVRVASGVYFYRLSHGDAAQSRKMMLVK